MLAKYGKVDILVNCAGIIPKSEGVGQGKVQTPVLSCKLVCLTGSHPMDLEAADYVNAGDLSEWSLALNINLLAPMALTNSFAPKMQEQKVGWPLCSTPLVPGRGQLTYRRASCCAYLVLCGPRSKSLILPWSAVGHNYQRCFHCGRDHHGHPASLCCQQGRPQSLVQQLSLGMPASGCVQALMPAQLWLQHVIQHEQHAKAANSDLSDSIRSENYFIILAYLSSAIQISSTPLDTLRSDAMLF